MTTGTRSMERVSARVTWDGETIAESDDAIEVQGDVHFPPEDVDMHRIKRPENDTARSGDQATAASSLGEAEFLHVIEPEGAAADPGEPPGSGPDTPLETEPSDPDDRYKSWLENAAWTYPVPEPEYAELAEHVAFAVEDTPLELVRWRGEDDQGDPGEGLGDEGYVEPPSRGAP